MQNPDLTGSSTMIDPKEAKRTKFKIEVEGKEEFPNLIRGGIATLYDIMEKVTEVFSAAYKDFAGCYIQPYAQGGLEVKLFFTTPAVDNGGAAYAFQLASQSSSADNGNSNGSSILAALKTIESRNKVSTMYVMTDEGKEGLAEFFNNGLRKRLKDGTFGDPNWKQFVGEQSNGGYQQQVYAVVTGLDIYKLLAEIYGTKDEDGQYLQYEIKLIRPASQTTVSGGLDWLVMLNRVGMKELDKVSRKAGIINTNGIPMVSRH